MNFPSRGLRLSATTMRNTGLFFAPIRFMRILTAIYQESEWGRLPMTRAAPGLFSDFGSKRGVSLFRLGGVGKPCFSIGPTTIQSARPRERRLSGGRHARELSRNRVRNASPREGDTRRHSAKPGS